VDRTSQRLVTWLSGGAYRLPLAYVPLHALAVAVSYAAVGAGGRPIMWLASGTLGAVLVSIRRNRWLAVIAAALPTEVAMTALLGVGIHDGGAGASLLQAFVTAIEGYVGATLFMLGTEQRSPPPTERVVRAVFAIAVTAVASGALRAGFRSLLFEASFWASLRAEWAAPFLGALAIGPLVMSVAYVGRGYRGQSDGSWHELLAAALLTFATCGYVFSSRQPLETFSLHYALFPLLLWVAARFRPRDTFIVVAGVGFATSMLHARGTGPFAAVNQPGMDHTLGLQIFLIMLMATALLVTVSRHEYRLLQQRLLENARRLYSAEDAGRRAAGIQLHDGIGQMLVALGLHVGNLRRSPQLRPELADRLDECGRLIRETHAATRRLLADLHPPGLADLGLLAAIQGLVARVNQRGPLQIEFHGTGRIDPQSMQRRLLLYRCARELLASVAQHAGARRAEVELREEQGAIELEVRDPVSGWDPAPWQDNYAAGRAGLFGLKDQIELLHGKLHISSSPDRGCRVRIRLPPQAA
jgi:signal transduction histidine kinase